MKAGSEKLGDQIARLEEHRHNSRKNFWISLTFTVNPEMILSLFLIQRNLSNKISDQES